MPKKPSQLALHRICATLVLAALTVPILASGTSNPWDQTDWKQWTARDVRNILTNSPWVSYCCPERDGGDANPLETAVIMSSQTVREALVRHMQLDKRYATVDLARRREIDRNDVRRISAGLKPILD